jgi:hypothetical protein
MMSRTFSVLFLLLPAIAAVGMPQMTHAQCLVKTVTVDGDVRSVPNNAQILVRVHANRGKETSEASGKPDGARFRIAVGFDTFVSFHLFGGHNCSRHPTTVDVILLAGGVAKQAVKLSLERDFTWDEKRSE